MRSRTSAGLIRALLLGCVGVILLIVAVRGLTHHHTPAQPEAAHAPAHLYSSTAKQGRDTLPATRIQAANTLPSRVAPSGREPQVRSKSQSALATQQNPTAVSELAARFPALAHQAITADPSGGTEAQYFLRLGNLLNGTPLAPGTGIGPNADHLARAEADLDHDDFAAAIGETEQLSAPAASVMSGWLADAKSRVTLRHSQPAPARVAQSASQTRAWPYVMPTEIPPFARESSDRPPSR